MIADLTESLTNISDDLKRGPIDKGVAEDFINFFIIFNAGSSLKFIDSDAIFKEMFIELSGDRVVKRSDWGNDDIAGIVNKHLR